MTFDLNNEEMLQLYSVAICMQNICSETELKCFVVWNFTFCKF